MKLTRTTNALSYIQHNASINYYKLGVSLKCLLGKLYYPMLIKHFQICLPKF